MISDSSEEADSSPNNTASRAEDEPRFHKQTEQENGGEKLEQQDPVPTEVHSLRSVVLINSSLQQHPI
jgi:hypothetical protein